MTKRKTRMETEAFEEASQSQGKQTESKHSPYAVEDAPMNESKDRWGCDVKNHDQ